MIEYRIVYSNSICDFEEDVNAYLRQGWELQGGLVVRDDGWYYQAIVRLNESL